MREEGVSQTETAQLFGVKPALVIHLLRNEKLGKCTVTMIKEKRDLAKQRRSKVQECVDELVNNNRHVWKVKQVQTAVMERSGLKV